MTYVLDASAVLALLKCEPGQERVAALVAGSHCLISAVNWAETATKLSDSGHPAALVKATLAALNPEVVAFDATQAIEAGLLRPLTRSLGLSLGDRACLALAITRQAAVVTADRPWLQLADRLGLSIECIRPAP